MKLKLVLGLVAMALLLSSCGLLPEEEILPPVPVIRDYEKQEYKQMQVQRGDLVLSKSIACTYDIVMQEHLAFSVGGVPIEKIYVTKGQNVQAGDLLGTLELENVQEQINSQEHVIARLALQLDQLYEMRALALEKHDYILEGLEQQLREVEQQIADAQAQPPATEEPAEPTEPTEQTQTLTVGEREDTAMLPEQTEPPSEPEEPAVKPDITELLLQQQALLQEITKQEAAKAATLSEYAGKIGNMEDSLYIQNLRLSEMEQSVSERQISTSFDGIVTYVREFKEGDRSVKGKTMVSVCNWDFAYFQVKGEKNVGYFSVGMQVDIHVGNSTHKAIVVDPVENCIPADPDVPTVYLQLVQPDPTISDGKYGTIQIVLDQRKDVLYLNRDAIVTSGGITFVYILDEKGLRTIREVKTGLETDDYVEITEGLQEGDLVILE